MKWLTFFTLLSEMVNYTPPVKYCLIMWWVPHKKKIVCCLSVYFVARRHEKQIKCEQVSQQAAANFAN